MIHVPLTRAPLFGATSAVLLLGACSDAPAPTASRLDAPALARAAGAPAPSGVLEVSYGDDTRMIWPFTGTSFDGTPSDPINLIFVGLADPRNLRAALMSLDGQRPAFPGFDCIWNDAVGEVQAGYSDDGWSGSAIQLECGDYNSIRVHIRFFTAGGWTLANAHLDVLIPDTPLHQVISWEFARQFVVYDFVRSGLLSAPPAATGPLYGATFRTIPMLLFNALPATLRFVLTGSPAPAAADVPLATSTAATVLQVGQTMPQPVEVRSYVVEASFNRVIPKPVCNEGNEFVLVQGPMTFHQEVRTTAAGQLITRTELSENLSVTPIDPFTGSPGETGPATIRRSQRTMLHDGFSSVSYSQHLKLTPRRGPGQQQLEQLEVGPNELTRYSTRSHCGPGA